MQNLEVAAPNGRGEVNVGLEAGGARFASGSYGLTAGELALSYGVSQNDDVTARFGVVSGFELGVKHTFRFSGMPSFLLAADARAGLHMSSAAVPLPGANVGVIAQWSPLASLHLLASPRLLVSSSGRALWTDSVVFEDNEATGFKTMNSDVALMPAATLGLAVDVRPSLRLVAEAGWIFAPLLDSGAAASAPASQSGLLRGTSVAIAIQWRPGEAGIR